MISILDLSYSSFGCCSLKCFFNVVIREKVFPQIRHLLFLKPLVLRGFFLDDGSDIFVLSDPGGGVVVLWWLNTLVLVFDLVEVIEVCNSKWLLLDEWGWNAALGD